MATLIETAQSWLTDCEEEANLLAQNPTQGAVEAFRNKWLSKKGLWTQLFEQLKEVPKEEKPQAGKILNTARQKAQEYLSLLEQNLKKALVQKSLQMDPVDVSLPSHRNHLQGAGHPVVLMRHKLLEVFRSFGFTIFDGPEIDYDIYNFSYLNIPEYHPARDMQDTFFLNQEVPLVLRTHTSNIQIHSMLQNPPPLKLIAPGRVYRVDNDATHSPMFHQMECVLVDRDIGMGHMKGLIDSFMKEVFGLAVQTRLRPSYFPFVEPGAEIDLSCTICNGKGCRVCKHTGWLEIGGCGLIHPNVFESVSYDTEEYTGFAFGFGLDRMAMLYWQIPDLRQMFEGCGSYSQSFPIHLR